MFTINYHDVNLTYYMKKIVFLIFKFLHHFFTIISANVITNVNNSFPNSLFADIEIIR